MTKLRVLLVEDEGMIVMALQEILEGMGHEVCATASTEADAVAAAYHFHPDLMIVDGRLRIGSGIAAMRKILTKRHVPHIYVSGDSLVAETLERGAVIMRKPFSDADLTRAIAKALAAPSQHTASGGNPQSQLS
ncbi:response regulator [Devosia sp.]|uniref:response regulator n=1 Tax=Devosia sp. TaxID=1871048 RepID=UPI003267369E